MSWKVGAGVAGAALVVAWLLGGRWLWILGLEVALDLIVLLALVIAAGMMRLWLDGVQQQRGEQLRKWRMDMKRKRKQLEDEAAELRKRVQDHERARGAAR